jgi:hypothetical protein
MEEPQGMNPAYYTYRSGDGEKTDITYQDISEAIDDFLIRTEIKEFQGLSSAEFACLRKRLFSFIVALGQASQYHPCTYLDSIDQEDIDAFMADVKNKGEKESWQIIKTTTATF